MISVKNEKFLINIILVLFIVGITCCFTLFPLLSETVSAEELSNNSVLNFNQLFDISKISSTNIVDSIYVSYDLTQTGFYNLNQTISVYSNHKYLILGAVPGLCRLQIDSSAGIIYISDSIYFTTSSFTGTATIYLYGVSSGTYKEIIQVFDLTQCFGSGNEPTTINEFKSYFNNDYYAFTPSTLISLNTLDSYTNGVNDTLSNLSYNFTAVDSYNRISNANVTINNVTYDSTLNKTTLGSDFVSLGVPGVSQNGVLYFPFSSTLNAGDTISLSGFYGYAVFGSGTYSVDIVVVSGDSFSIIDTSSKTGSDIDDLKHIENLNYTLPFSCSGIYFISKGAGVYVSNFTISLQVLNFQSLIDDAYNRGKDSVDIESIKSQAFNNGKQAGIESANKYTFSALVSSVVDAPIKAITGLLNFEIFGVNLKSFMLSIFTIAVVIAIVKLFLGNVGGSSAK